MSVSYGGDKITFDDGTSIASGLSHFRNRIINGAMEIDQRNNGAAVTHTDNTNTFYIDRFRFGYGSGGTFVSQQVTDAPTGFKNSLRMTVSAADTPASSDGWWLFQGIEGNNVSDLLFGTASAKTVTLSFWVKSSVTGTYGVNLDNGSTYTRHYCATYTINSANTWEYKTITVPGDTTGTWATNNTTGIGLRFFLGAGSTFKVGTPNSWNTGNGSDAVVATGTVNWVSTLNATWQVTGVQLEQGSYATTFERRPYGTELQLCQRYCVKYGGSNNYEFAPFTTLIAAGSGVAYGLVASSVPMRTVPTYTSNTLRLVDENVGFAVTSISSSGNTYGNNYGTEVAFNVASGLTQYRPYFVQMNGSTSAFLIMSAEL